MSGMVWKKCAAAVVIGAACAWLALSAPAQGEELFKARLSTVPIDPAMRVNITGKGSLTAVLTGAKLTITGSFEGLRTPATVAHLHQGRVMGVRGPAVFDLVVSKAT